MQKLERGIHTFRANYFAANKKLFEQLAANGQRPETLFITCSDARVVPHLLTSAAPGELFIVRNVGNIVSSPARGIIGGVAASIEYAVEVLRVQNVIVCGHTACGAMAAILQPESIPPLKYVQRWLGQAEGLRELIATRYAGLGEQERFVAAVQENVLAQLENLRSFDFVARRLEDGILKINGWVYKLETGQVFDYNPEIEQFTLLASEGEAPETLSERPPSIEVDRG